MSFSYMGAKFIAMYLISLFPIFLVGVFSFYIGEIYVGALSVGIYLTAVHIIARLFIFRRIIITEEGVTHKTGSKETLLMWSEIKTIGVPRRSIVSGYNKWIYFSKYEMDNTSVIGTNVNDSFFIVNYRKRILDEIRKHWNSEILGV